jgi:hypothetical protein
MRTCSVEGCGAPHQARGFCSMHYARAKRHGGDTSVVGKAGRPKSELLAMLRANVASTGWSPRTIERYVRAVMIIGDVDLANMAIRKVTRPSGSVNVSLLLAVAEEVASEEPEASP